MSPTPDAAGTRMARRLQDEARGLGMSLRMTRARPSQEATAGDQDGTGWTARGEPILSGVGSRPALAPRRTLDPSVYSGISPSSMTGGSTFQGNHTGRSCWSAVGSDSGTSPGGDQVAKVGSTGS
ncbi:MAG: hypothetical protein RIT28_3342 [Pseudomonadota bacterium]